MKHSTVDPTAKVYNETAGYLCEVGHSVDEKPQSNTNGCFEMQCSHSGSYVPVRSGAEQCLPVVCTDVPDVNNAERTSFVRWCSKSSCECMPGLSTDEVVGGNRAVSAR